MKSGYARVSTNEQSKSALLDALNSAGCECIYQEKCNGKLKQRPGLERMVEALRANDLVV